MGYKSPNAFKGSEFLWQRIAMTAKMHFHTFLLVGGAYLGTCIVILVVFEAKNLAVLASYIFQTATSFVMPKWDLVGKWLGVFFSNTKLLLLCALPIWLFYPWLLARYKKESVDMMADKHLRGAKICEVKELSDELRKENKTDEKSIDLGEIKWPREYEPQHMAILGRAGSGKTTLIYNILDNLRSRGAKAVIHDLKGDFVPIYYQPDRDLIFNSADARSVRWTVTNEIETLADIESITHSLIPPGKGQDRFWIDAARDVLFSILFFAVVNNKRTNKDLWEIMSLSEGELLKIMVYAVEHGHQECRKALGYLQGESKGSKVASDVLSTMRQYTNAFMYLKDCDGDFKLKDWVNNGQGGFLYVVNYAQLQDTLRPILSLMVDLSAKNTLALPDDFNRRIFFLLDEFPQLQQLPALLNILAAGRSKGASVILSCQDINQIITLYTRERMGSIINNCNTAVAFATGDPQSQEYLSSMFGDREILETDESISMGQDEMREGLSVTRRRKTERLILASEFGGLEKFSCLVKMLHHDIVRTGVTRKNRPYNHPALVEKTQYRLSERGQIANEEVKL